MLFLWFFIAWWLMAVSVMAREAYGNWDFMDLPGCCATRRVEEEDDTIPRFGGTPNQSQVWSLNGCGCGKFFH
jgi:hypothetical protein